MRVEIKPFSDEYEAIAAIMVANNPMNFTTADSIRHIDGQAEPRHKLRRWVAIREGQVIGVAQMSYSLFTINLEDLYVGIEIHPNFQHQGVGTQLCHPLSSAIDEEAPHRLKAIILENQPAAHAFASKYGFTEYARRWDSTLDLTKVNLDPFLPSLKKTADNGIVIKSMTELSGKPDFARKNYDLVMKTREDIPYPDPISPMAFDVFKKMYMQNPVVYETGSFFALDGNQLVGITVLLKPSEERLYVGYTAILREYRRKGLATALKVLSIQHALDQGFKFLGTTNDTLNEAILKLNDAMGFIRQPAQIMLVRHIKND